MRRQGNHKSCFTKTKRPELPIDVGINPNLRVIKGSQL